MLEELWYLHSAPFCIWYRTLVSPPPVMDSSIQNLVLSEMTRFLIFSDMGCSTVQQQKSIFQFEVHIFSVCGLCDCAYLVSLSCLFTADTNVLLQSYSLYGTIIIFPHILLNVHRIEQCFN